MSEPVQPTAKLFQHGRSQAVRLPKEFRFAGTEVYVRRQGDDVVLSSRPRASIRSLIDALDAFDRDRPIVRNQPTAADGRSHIAAAPRPRTARRPR